MKVMIVFFSLFVFIASRKFSNFENIFISKIMYPYTHKLQEHKPIVTFINENVDFPLESIKQTLEKSIELKKLVNISRLVFILDTMYNLTDEMLLSKADYVELVIHEFTLFRIYNTKAKSGVSILFDINSISNNVNDGDIISTFIYMLYIYLKMLVNYKFELFIALVISFTTYFISTRVYNNNHSNTIINHQEITTTTSNYNKIYYEKGRRLPTAKDINATEQEKKCQVCCINRINTVIIDCGHSYLCSNCAKIMLKADDPSCPICRKRIVEGFINVFDAV